MSNHHSNNNRFDPSKPVVVSSSLGGPKTDIGRAISSRNSLRHGSCADTLILRAENQQDYDKLEAAWLKTYSPADESERHLVQELVTADWFLQRATRNVAEVELRLFDTEPDQLNWTEEQHRNLTRFLRYQTTRANNFNRCRKAVEEFRRSRATEKLSEVKLDAAKTRQRVFVENNGNGLGWKAHLEGMRQKAIALGRDVPPLSPQTGI